MMLKILLFALIQYAKIKKVETDIGLIFMMMNLSQYWSRNAEKKELF